MFCGIFWPHLLIIEIGLNLKWRPGFHFYKELNTDGRDWKRLIIDSFPCTKWAQFNILSTKTGIATNGKSLWHIGSGEKNRDGNVHQGGGVSIPGSYSGFYQFSIFGDLSVSSKKITNILIIYWNWCGCFLNHEQFFQSPPIIRLRTRQGL